MKRVFLLLSILLLNNSLLFSQVAINTDGSPPDPSAMLDVKSQDRGLLIPRISTLDRNQIPSPATGLLIYNTTTNLFNFYNGNSWYQIESSFISSTIGTLSVAGGVSINALSDSTPENSAMLSINNPTRGLLLPRTTPELIDSPVTGLIIYNTDTNCLSYYDGGQWKTLHAVSNGVTCPQGSQTSVGVAYHTDRSGPHHSAMLDVSADDKGILIPRLTDLQRDDLLPATGLLIYNTSVNRLEFYNGSAWHQFIITSDLPIISTTDVSDIKATQATSGGTIFNNGGAAIIARGISWSSHINPTISDLITSDGIGNGNFTSNLKGLMGNTTYFVRAYATNDLVTNYGNEISFKTPPFNLVCVYGIDSVTLKIENFDNSADIEWQESLDTINWATIPGAMDNTYQFLPTQTKYYRAVIKTSIAESQFSVTKIIKQSPLLKHVPPILMDRNTVAWFDYKTSSSLTKNSSNLISRWNDILGSGHDLLQPNGTNQPLLTQDGVLFDGIDDFMKTDGFAYNQPEYMYLVINQITYSDNDKLIDGNTNDSGLLTQRNAPNNLQLYAGTVIDYPYSVIGDPQIIKVLISGSTSKIQVNSKLIVSGNAGTTNMGGISLARSVDSTAGYGNILVKEAIFRKVDDSLTPQSEADIYNYLSDKYTIDKKVFEKGGVVFTIDDGFDSDYTIAMPLFKSKGITGTFFTRLDFIGVAGNVTWDNIKSIQAAGNEIGSHGTVGDPFPTITESILRTDLATVKSEFLAHSLLEPETVAYPSGRYNDMTLRVCKEFYKLGRRVGASSIKYPFDDKFLINGVDISQHNPHTLQSVKDKIDEAKKYNYILVLMIHKIVPGAPAPDSYEINTTELGDIIDYCKSIGIDVIRFKDVYSKMH